MSTQTFDPVALPEHYNTHPSGIEPIEITQHLNFCLGNVVKYVMRCDLKGKAIEDLRKARTYLDYEIARRETLALRNYSKRDLSRHYPDRAAA